ncbi:hypothetical protein M422DRAFT_255595 [Sphaerobolus stellatus SS14]|uniref:Uncharacterized protein n=1 Tax=Sphaerobolus stellatus (strain SS14) TaxID=990650 RepID=A0A0C9UEL5_SPHS4|nr:hypothetical protein M422DRAFT_255595 [Sphaerobolus stellatus SS14]
MLTISPDTGPQRILQQLTSPLPRGVFSNYFVAGMECFEEPEHQPSLSRATLARKPAVSGEHQILQPTDKYEANLPHPLLLCQIGEALGVHPAIFMEHPHINSHLADASSSRVPDLGVPQATPFQLLSTGVLRIAVNLENHIIFLSSKKYKEGRKFGEYF